MEINECYCAEVLRKEAADYNKFVDDMEQKFCNLKEEEEDKEALCSYIFDTIKKLSSIGCTLLEYETDTDLNKVYPELICYLDRLGYEYHFYELTPEYAKHKYCLQISWNE